MSEAKNHYVDRKRFTDEINEHTKKTKRAIKGKKPPPEIPEYVVDSVMRMCKGMGMRSNWNGYTYIDDMISDAMENCIKALRSCPWGRFTKEKGDAFGYFNMIISNSFIGTLAKEKGVVLSKRGYVENSFMRYIPEGGQNTVDMYEEYMEKTQDVADFFAKKRKKK